MENGRVKTEEYAMRALVVPISVLFDVNELKAQATRLQSRNAKQWQLHHKRLGFVLYPTRESAFPRVNVPCAPQTCDSKEQDRIYETTFKYETDYSSSAFHCFAFVTQHWFRGCPPKSSTLASNAFKQQIPPLGTVWLSIEPISSTS